MRTLGTMVAAVALVFLASAAAQNCGWSRIVHLVSLDNSGIWNPNVSRGLTAALTIAEVGGAIWEGSGTRFGKTMWQRIDSELIRAGAAEAGKYIFTRTRPDQQDNPCLWSRAARTIAFRAAKRQSRRRSSPPKSSSTGATIRQPTCCSCCRSTRGSYGSGSRRTGRPTCWPAGPWVASRAGTRTAAMSRS